MKPGHRLTLPLLPAALRRLIQVLRQRLERPSLDSSLREAWSRLVPELEHLATRQPLRQTFEQAVAACHAACFADSEGFLEFLYASTYEVLTEQVARWLRAYRVQDDIESTAVDLVSQLFLELTDKLFDRSSQQEVALTPGDSALGATSPAPYLPKEHLLPWLFRALKNDVMDRAKAASNRLTRSGPSQPEEILISRAPLLELSDPDLLTPLELLERRNVFLAAFGRATEHLKMQHRRVLHLREVETLKPDEIARRLNLTRQQVLDQLQYGREKRADLLLGQLIRHPATRDLEPEAHRLKQLLTRVSLSPLVTALSQEAGAPAAASSPETLALNKHSSAIRAYVIGGLEGKPQQGGEPAQRPPAFQSSGESPPAHERWKEGPVAVVWSEPVPNSEDGSAQSLMAEPELSVASPSQTEAGGRERALEQVARRQGGEKQLEALPAHRRAALVRRSEKR